LARSAQAAGRIAGVTGGWVGQRESNWFPVVLDVDPTEDLWRECVGVVDDCVLVLSMFGDVGWSAAVVDRGVEVGAIEVYAEEIAPEVEEFTEPLMTCEEFARVLYFRFGAVGIKNEWKFAEEFLWWLMLPADIAVDRSEFAGVLDGWVRVERVDQPAPRVVVRGRYDGSPILAPLPPASPVSPVERVVMDRLCLFVGQRIVFPDINALWAKFAVMPLLEPLLEMVAPGVSVEQAWQDRLSFFSVDVSDGKVLKAADPLLKDAERHPRKGEANWFGGGYPELGIAFVRRMAEAGQFTGVRASVYQPEQWSWFTGIKNSVFNDDVYVTATVRVETARTDGPIVYPDAMVRAIIGVFCDLVKAADAIQADIAFRTSTNGRDSDLMGLFGAGRNDGCDRDSTFVRDYVWVVYLPPELVAKLGGIEHIVAVAPVFATFVIDTAHGQGVVLQQTARPDQVDEHSRRALRTFLLPVLVEPMHEANIRNEPSRFDILPEDWARAIPNAIWPC
jgi:hypothetical protein